MVVVGLSDLSVAVAHTRQLTPLPGRPRSSGTLRWIQMLSTLPGMGHLSLVGLLQELKSPKLEPCPWQRNVLPGS